MSKSDVSGIPFRWTDEAGAGGNVITDDKGDRCGFAVRHRPSGEVYRCKLAPHEDDAQHWFQIPDAPADCSFTVAGLGMDWVAATVVLGDDA